MSKISLAVRFADELGVSVSKASKFIDDVGAKQATTLVDEAAEAGSRTVSKWAKPAAAGGILAGGGALAWNQQETEQAKAISDSRQSYSDALTSILEDDSLSPAMKRELAKDLTDASGAGDDENGDDGNGPLGGLLGGDPATLIVLIIVLALVMRYSLGDD